MGVSVSLTITIRFMTILFLLMQTVFHFVFTANMRFKSNCSSTKNAECICKTGYSCKDNPCTLCVPIPATTKPTLPPSTTSKTQSDSHRPVEIEVDKIHSLYKLNFFVLGADVRHKGSIWILLLKSIIFIHIFWTIYHPKWFPWNNLFLVQPQPSSCDCIKSN